MALETGTYTSDLVATNPTAGDPKSQGDDHIRLVKSTIKNTLPNLTGPMTATQDELNACAFPTLAASVSANALTIALKTAAGNDPSSSEPVYLFFRSATSATGSMTVRSVTSALSITVPSGATLGQSNATAARLWVAAMDNAGTVELAVINTQLGNGQLAPVNEANFMTTAALSTASDNAGAWYSTTSRSNLSHRLVGFIENTQATAGTWATSPSFIQAMGPGVRKPGDLIQTVYTYTGTVTTDTTQIPADNTIPQNTEGAQYLSQSITPTSAINSLRIRARWMGATNATAGSLITAALFQDSTANALKASFVTPPSPGYAVVIDLSHSMQAATASATTMRVRAGASAAGTTTFNGTGGTQLMGGVADSYIEVVEVMA